MTIKYTGQISWANRDPIQGVEVRLFEPGDGEAPIGEELTLQPGYSQSDGNFTILARDTRLLDKSLLQEFEDLSPLFAGVGVGGASLGSDPRPIFQFTYTLYNQRVQSLACFRKLHRSYQLPHNPPVDFTPSKHGFRFKNNFNLFYPQITLPEWLGRKSISPTYGLCGGMSSAAYDFCLASANDQIDPDIRQYPRDADIPKEYRGLHRFLIKRSLDTFGPYCEKVDKIGDWTLLPLRGPAGTQRLSLDELPEIKRRLGIGQCVVLTLIYEHAANRVELVKKIWQNHQVLAYKYIEIDRDSSDICIYDPNYPDRDDAVLKVQQEQVGNITSAPVFGLVVREIVPGEYDNVVRGFFPMHYRAVSPPG